MTYVRRRAASWVSSRMNSGHPEQTELFGAAVAARADLRNEVEESQFRAAVKPSQ
jgi:hypothetical protein